MHIFSFNGTVDSYSDCLLIFLGSDNPDPTVITDAYVRWTASNVAPPATLIVGSKEVMHNFWTDSSDGAYCKTLTRLYGYGRANSVTIAGFDNQGRVTNVADGHDLSELFNCAVSSYIESQVRDGDVVIPAPLGTYFDKLSGRYSSHFIRAEALLHSTACIEMLALRLLGSFSEWFDRVASNLEVATIYIDTMSVWPVAEKLKQFHSAGRSQAIEYHLESFRSYDGLREWQPPRRPSFVIISATTSGGLAKAVQKKLNRKAEIRTLLSLATAAQHDDLYKAIAEIPQVLEGRSALDGLRATFEANISTVPPGTETITIVGERFLSQIAKPKRVRLVHSKLDQSLKKDLAWLARRHLVKIGRQRFDGRDRWTVSFELDKLIDELCSEDKKGNSWLTNQLQYLSLTPRVAIIYPSADGTSAHEVRHATTRFAHITQAAILKLSPDAEVYLLGSDELARDSREMLRDLSGCSVIVASPIIGNGFAFKQISALLRLRQPKGSRLFLSLVTLPETSAQLTQLEQDIAKVDTPEAKYDLAYKFAFPIGRLDMVFGWQREQELLALLGDKLSEHDVQVPWLAERMQGLQTLALRDDRSVFMSAANGTPLGLSTGFFLWYNSSNIEGDDYAPTVLLTIAALLQSARTSRAKSADTSLRSWILQQALICPESFTRFNDPVIQAAILRAAYPSELNYSVSPDMSHDMTRLLLKLLQYYEHAAGAAAPEFLLAIACAKLKLTRSDLKEVFGFAKSNCKGWVKHLAEVAEHMAFSPAI
jgi:hypothetical protein